MKTEIGRQIYDIHAQLMGVVEQLAALYRSAPFDPEVSRRLRRQADQHLARVKALWDRTPRGTLPRHDLDELIAQTQELDAIFTKLHCAAISLHAQSFARSGSLNN